MTTAIKTEAAKTPAIKTVKIDVTNLNREFPTVPVPTNVLVVYEVAMTRNGVPTGEIRRYVRQGILNRMGVVCYDNGGKSVQVFTFPGKKTDRIWRKAMIEDYGFYLVLEMEMLGWFLFESEVIAY